MWWAIGSWFHFSHIPANAASNPYYRSVISIIEIAGQGVDLSGPKNIYDQLLDSNKKDLQRWIASYKNKWPTYGLTVMCDGWIDLTRWRIINFLIYCDGKIFFHKSIDASDKMHDAIYILGLMKWLIQWVNSMSCESSQIIDHNIRLPESYWWSRDRRYTGPHVLHVALILYWWILKRFVGCSR